jgi:hypothetical protein
VTNDTSKRWIEAGIVLSRSPDARVMCPECAQVPLEILDGERPDGPKLVERYMRCVRCGAHQIITGVRIDAT